MDEGAFVYDKVAFSEKPERTEEKEREWMMIRGKKM